MRHSGERIYLLCPFHSEKTPSFMVRPDGSGICFGCHKHDSAVGLVAAMLGKSRSDAARWLGLESSATPRGVGKSDRRKINDLRAEQRFEHRREVDTLARLVHFLSGSDVADHVRRQEIRIERTQAIIKLRDLLVMPMESWDAMVAELCPSFPDYVLHAARYRRTVNPEGADMELPDDVRSANTAAWEYFSNCDGRGYLEQRGLGSTPFASDIGRAPADGEIFPEAISVPLPVQLRAGLLDRRSAAHGKMACRFRDRVMIPLRDGLGSVVGFAGRLLGQWGPKYLNSPTSSWFQKKLLLYGYTEAEREIRINGNVTVVEGYADVWALAPGAVVATMGTALTQEQARLLSTCGRVTLMYDGDSPGRKAAVSAFPVLVAQGVWPRVVFLPNSNDPADMVVKGLAFPDSTSLFEPWIKSMADDRAASSLISGILDPWVYDAVMARLSREGVQAPPPPPSIGGLRLRA
jgi:DNA primase